METARTSASRSTRPGGGASESPPFLPQKVVTQTILNALRKDRHLLFERSPASRSKSAWLRAITREALKGDGQLVIVAATDRRRRQLIETELPAVGSMAPGGLSVVVLEPTSTYVCLERLQHLQRRAEAQRDSSEAAPESSSAREPGRMGRKRGLRPSCVRGPGRVDCLPGLSASELSQLPRLERWARSTQCGRVECAPQEVSNTVLRLATLEVRECLRDRCPFVNECFGLAAARSASNADVVVCDYSTLAEWLLVRKLDGTSRMLNGGQIIVLEEADRATDQLRRSLTDSCSPAVAHRLAHWLLVSGLADEARELLEESGRLDDELRAHRNGTGHRSRQSCREAVHFERLMDTLALVSTAVRKRATAHPSDSARLKWLGRRATELVSLLELAAEWSNADTVVQLHANSREEMSLQTLPLNLDSHLAALNEDCRCVVATSHTLAVNGRCGYIRNALGLLDNAVECVQRHTPFMKGALLVVPESVPDPVERTWAMAASRRFLEIQGLTRGRSIGYFVSDAVLEHLQAQVRFPGMRLVRAADDRATWVDLVPSAPAPAGHAIPADGNVDEHPVTSSCGCSAAKGSNRRDASDSSLLTPPGSQAYCCLVIDRLPFPHWDDPILQSLRDHDANWFPAYALPRAVLEFRRVIHAIRGSSSRRLVIVVFDRRILTRPYGRHFLESFPGLSISRRQQHISRFLDGKEPV